MSKTAPAGDIRDTPLVDALAAGTPLILADGTALSFEQLLAMIPDLDPGAFAPAAVAPAAGAPATGSTAGFGINEEYDGTGFDGGRDFVAVLDEPLTEL